MLQPMMHVGHSLHPWQAQMPEKFLASQMAQQYKDLSTPGTL